SKVSGKCLLKMVFCSVADVPLMREFPSAFTPPRIVHHPSDVVVKVGNPATLSCRADGSPKPTIEWLRNNQPLETANRELQPMILSDGSLFFLSVEGGRQRQSHEGVYTCVARNSAGKDTSRNASLFIAGQTCFNLASHKQLHCSHISYVFILYFYNVSIVVCL
uniref:Ig-like domain-containing protein n=1 Tax=Oreochromis aureus TaxID=47969 RepID=A0A668SEB3_OREAU